MPDICVPDRRIPGSRIKEEEIENTTTGKQAVPPAPDVPSWVHGRSKGADGVQSSGRGYLLKRPLDILLASVGLLIASHMWLLFSVAIKIGDRGPILFTQDR